MQSLDENFVYTLYTGRTGIIHVPLALMIRIIEATVFPNLQLTKTASSNDAARYILQGRDEKIELAFSRNGDETQIKVTPDINHRIGLPLIPITETRKITASFLAEVLNQAIQSSPEAHEEETKKSTVKGEYDDLCIEWVKTADFRNINKKDFLSNHDFYYSTKTFDRILKQAYKNGLIDKDQKTGHYREKNVPKVVSDSP